MNVWESLGVSTSNRFDFQFSVGLCFVKFKKESSERNAIFHYFDFVPECSCDQRFSRYHRYNLLWRDVTRLCFIWEFLRLYPIKHAVGDIIPNYKSPKINIVRFQWNFVPLKKENVTEIFRKWTFSYMTETSNEKKSSYTSVLAY